MNQSKQPEALRLAQEFEDCVKVDAIPSINDIAEAAAELRRLHQHELAQIEWLEKTEWVQKSARPSELGKHRADVISDRIAEKDAEICRLHARVQELEEDLQLARQGIGAEAYDMACEEMEAYQLKRAKAGKEAGTTLSLVDGMAWVYERLDELEAQSQRVPLTNDEIDKLWSEIELSIPQKVVRRGIARSIERAHGIGKETK